MDRTPLQRLASLHLGRDVIDWLRDRQAAGVPTFRRLAAELCEASNGEIDVTDETIRLWLLEEAEAAS